jgi:hypothetical protein
MATTTVTCVSLVLFIGSFLFHICDIADRSGTGYGPYRHRIQLVIPIHLNGRRTADLLHSGLLDLDLDLDAVGVVPPIQ